MIRNLFGLLIALGSTGLCGCYTANATGAWGPYGNSLRNVTEESARAVDRLFITHRLKSEADRAWEAVEAASPPHFYSPDYAKGFKNGFTDYVEAGGNGSPPAVPPDYYRLDCCKTPDGHHAMQDWFAGFRHGASIAMQSGLREAILVPVSSVPRPSARTAELDGELGAAPSQPPPAAREVERFPTESILPPPRPVLPPS